MLDGALVLDRLLWTSVRSISDRFPHRGIGGMCGIAEDGFDLGFGLGLGEELVAPVFEPVGGSSCSPFITFEAASEDRTAMRLGNARRCFLR